MAFRTRSRRSRTAAMITIELVVAMAMLVGAMLPLAFSLVREQRLGRAYYLRAVAIETVDGEMETLLAGGWRAWPVGTHPYTPRAEAARNLPPGRFLITRGETTLRLEWRPNKAGQGGPVWRAGSVAPHGFNERSRP